MLPLLLTIWYSSIVSFLDQGFEDRVFPCFLIKNWFEEKLARRIVQSFRNKHFSCVLAVERLTMATKPRSTRKNATIGVKKREKHETPGYGIWTTRTWRSSSGWYNEIAGHATGTLDRIRTSYIPAGRMIHRRKAIRRLAGVDRSINSSSNDLDSIRNPPFLPSFPPHFLVLVPRATAG